jgi:hypothetical protein
VTEAGHSAGSHIANVSTLQPSSSASGTRLLTITTIFVRPSTSYE